MMNFKNQVISRYKIVTKVLQFPKKKQNEHDFDLKYDDRFLADKTQLTYDQLKEVRKEIKRVSAVIDQCDSNFDQDVIDNLIKYLEKIADRLKNSNSTIDVKHDDDMALKKAKLKLIKSGLMRR